jgi:hypothetical protein
MPDEPAALISLKRMAVGQYTYTLNIWRKSNYYYPFGDMNTLKDEFRRARTEAIDLLQHVGIGGTAIDVDTMVGEPCQCSRDTTGYSSRPWENDAFFCGEMATAYWRAELGEGLKTYPADECSREYEHADSNAKVVASMERRLRDAGSGSSGGSANN